MKLLEVKSEKELFEIPDIRRYDVVILKHKISPGSMHEGKKLHVTVTSESPALGTLKIIDRYLKEKIGLTPITYKLPKLGSVEFDYCKYHDIYRVYGSSIPKEGFMNIGMSSSDYVLQIENCAFGRMLTPKLPGLKGLESLPIEDDDLLGGNH